MMKILNSVRRLPS